MLMSLLLIILFSMFSSVAYGMTEEDYVTDNLDEISDISRQHITQILQDKKGFLWLSSWNGLYRFDGYDFVSFKAKPGDGNDMNSDRFRNIVLDYDITPKSAVRGQQGDTLEDYSRRFPALCASHADVEQGGWYRHVHYPCDVS